MSRRHAPSLLRARPASAKAGPKPTDNGRNFLAPFGPVTMQISPKFLCRFFGQLVVAIGLLAAASLPARAEDAASPDAQSAPKSGQEKDGGVIIQVPQSPELAALKIGYLREIVEHPRPASRVDKEPKDAGIAGAQMAIEEDNAGGRFTGHDYSLDVSTVSSADKAVEALQKFYDSDHHYIVVDASADTLLKMADWAKGKDILLFNISATDVSLRQENCRANVMHIVPDRYMLADALAQYLVAMKWTDWLLVHGSTPGDLAYADAIKRAAGRFGAKIVDVREYKDTSGGRRDDVGTIPPGGDESLASKQASLNATVPATPDYQVIVVADEDQTFRSVHALSRRRRPAAGGRHHGAHRHHLEPGPREMGRDPGQQQFRKGLPPPDAADRLPGLCGDPRHRRSGHAQR